MAAATRRIRMAAVGMTVFVVAGVAGVAAAPHANAAISVTCPSGNLQNAINAAPAGSTINVRGTCTGNFVVTKDLRIVGPATLDGGGSGTVITTDAGNVRLVDLTIRNGNGNFAGGIRNDGTLTVVDSRVTGNRASGFSSVVQDQRSQCTTPPCDIEQEQTVVGSAGAGVVNLGTLTLNETVVSGNSATGNGTVTQSQSAECTTNCTITQSQVAVGNAGAGILSSGGSVTIVDAAVANNTASGNGSVTQTQSANCTTNCSKTQDKVVVGHAAGVVLVNGATALLNEGEISQNTASDDGGGIVSAGGPVKLVDTDVVENETSARGGGIHNVGASLTLNESEVSENVAAVGGGILNEGGTVNLVDSDVEDNSPNNCVGC